MAIVDCKINIPPQEGLGPDLTVGRKFVLLCEGDIPDLDMTTSEIRLEESQKYALQLVQIDRVDRKTVEFVVVSYKPGSHSLPAVQLVDSQNSVLLGDLTFQVESVLQKNEIKKPFDSMGAVTLTWPVWIWMIGLALLGIFLLTSLWQMRRKNQRKKALEAFESFGTAQGPYAQMHARLRILNRKHSEIFSAKGNTPPTEAAEILEELELSLAIYVARTLQIIIRDRSLFSLGIELKKKAKKSKNQDLLKIFFLLRELRRAKKNKINLANQDLNQFLQLMRNLPDFETSPFAGRLQ